MVKKSNFVYKKREFYTWAAAKALAKKLHRKKRAGRIDTKGVKIIVRWKQRRKSGFRK